MRLKNRRLIGNCLARQFPIHSSNFLSPLNADSDPKLIGLFRASPAPMIQRACPMAGQHGDGDSGPAQDIKGIARPASRSSWRPTPRHSSHCIFASSPLGLLAQDVSPPSRAVAARLCMRMRTQAFGARPGLKFYRGAPLPRGGLGQSGPGLRFRLRF